MSDFIALLLSAAALAGLVLIPLGLPGLWVIVLSIAAYGWLKQFSPPITWEFIAVIIGLSLVTEAIDAWSSNRIRQRHHWSQGSGWSALVGGTIGAIAGVPLPLIGSVIGGVVGAFLGGLAFEYSRSRQLLPGRAAAVALKPGVGVAMIAAATWALFIGIGQWQGS